MTRLSRGVVIGAFLLLMRPTSLTSQAPLPHVVEFNRDIRPILSDKCYTCHGPDKTKRPTKLRFDIESEAKQDLGGRFAIVPGDPATSEMVRRIAASEPAKRMPPTHSGRMLAEREIELLRTWIAQGAKWEKHWSFIPPKRLRLPNLKDRSWAKNEIDYFILSRLEREGLSPSPEAERTVLIRRATLDLTGLPPTPAEVEAFLGDRSENAFEKVVDRLLRSPRYGERMATRWLDAARYADTHGYQSDGERLMWRWRDWVLNAFQQNMPFDQFTVEQIAGDMLPGGKLDQKIATGFNRNHRGNAEGGIIQEEYAVEYVVDRVETTSTVFLGLTLGCARCHDHKYDPFTQKEFYQIFAYFNNIPEKGKANRNGNSPPVIKAPTEAQQRELGELERKLAAAQKRFDGFREELVKAQRGWEASLKTETPIHWSLRRNLLASYPLDGAAAREVETPARQPAPSYDSEEGRKSLFGQSTRIPKAATAKFEGGQPEFVRGRIGQAASYDGKLFIDAGDVADFAFTDKFTLAAWIYPTADTGAIITRAEDVSDGAGYGLYLKKGKVYADMVRRLMNDGVRVETAKALDLHRWYHVMMTYDGSRVAEGIKIYVDGMPQGLTVISDDMTVTFPAEEPLRIGAGNGPANRFRGYIDDVRVYGLELSPAEAAVVAEPRSLNEIAALAPEARSKAQSDKMRLYFLDNRAPFHIRQAWQEVIDRWKEKEGFEESLPTVMVMQERETPRDTFVLIRGAYDKPGERVMPDVPAILPPLPQGEPKNRLGFARWLVDASNPLTARVAVNRFWQMYFGSGIVKTAEDFGSQGEWPTHPELLDWLATEFVRSGWDVKAMQKLIVTSATYRQSSKLRPELLQKDPENNLRATAPRLRLEAEMIRDQALAMAGLLVEQVGGPSVKPYQPAGLWKELSSADYKEDQGQKLYRRSLYTFWKRAVPPPSMMNFDAAGREACVVRQTRTNTPLQALDLMNNVTFMEASRMIGERMMKEAGPTLEDRVRFAFRLATARWPSPEETRILVEAFHHHLDNFHDRTAALKLLSQGAHSRDEGLNASELAAYTMVASMVLNLDETVTKE